MRRPPASLIEILSGRESTRRTLDRGDRLIIFLSLSFDDAAFRANPPSSIALVIFLNPVTSLINNLANITPSVIKIQRIFKMIHCTLIIVKY